MTTITLKINEKSKIGKIILDLINVEVLYLPNKETLKSIEKVEKGIGLIPPATARILSCGSLKINKSTKP